MFDFCLVLNLKNRTKLFRLVKQKLDYVKQKASIAEHDGSVTLRSKGFLVLFLGCCISSRGSYQEGMIIYAENDVEVQILRFTGKEECSGL